MENHPATAHFRFYGELQDHLSPEHREQGAAKQFFVSGSAKDMVESFGVPHVEVGMITVNGVSAELSALVNPGDNVEVYPDRNPAEGVSSGRFVLDVHLGKLAAYLRMLGFDAVYRSCFTDPELAQLSARESRILLTRDRQLLMRNEVRRGYWLRATDSRKQTAEVLARFHLVESIQPFARCMACNGVLRDATKDQVRHALPPRTLALHDHFRRCPQCGRVYWKGSHYARMQRWIEELSHPANAPA